MLINQPIYNPLISKRCLLMSGGNGETFSNWFQSNRHTIDFALRGYTVAYYENSGSTNIYKLPNLTVGDYLLNKILPVANPCVASNPSTIDKNRFYAAMYANLLISNAARNYIVTNSTSLKIDVNNLFVGGGSLGAATALFYAKSE